VLVTTIGNTPVCPEASIVELAPVRSAFHTSELPLSVQYKKVSSTATAKGTFRPRTSFEGEPLLPINFERTSPGSVSSAQNTLPAPTATERGVVPGTDVSCKPAMHPARGHG
jgi:hypothetical protein